MSAVVARPEGEGTLLVDRGDALRQAELIRDEAAAAHSSVATSGQLADWTSGWLTVSCDVGR